MAFTLHAAFADPIPPALVGEWVSRGAKFQHGILVKGGAVYLGPDGFAAILGAPPPIGMDGTGSYDPKTLRLTLHLHDNGTPPERHTMTIIYDANAKNNLTTKATETEDIPEAVYRRRRTSIPKWVCDEAK